MIRGGKEVGFWRAVPNDFGEAGATDTYPSKSENGLRLSQQTYKGRSDTGTDSKHFHHLMVVQDAGVVSDMKVLKSLIVDDDRDFADSLAVLVQACGHDVRVMYSGADAYQQIRDQRFDVAFVDVKMPDLGGIRFLHDSRDLDLEVRIFLMTGYRMESILRELTGNGHVAILHKPVDLASVTESFEQILPRGILLTVDDTPDIGQEINFALRQGGYAVSFQGDPAAGGLLQPSGDDAVAVIDIDAPVVGELEVYLDLVEQGHTGPTVIVARHALPTDVKVDPLTDPQVTGCLFKPFNVEDILSDVA